MALGGIVSVEAQAPDARIRHGYRTRAAVTIRTLDAISRTRSLSAAESERLYQAIRDERRHLTLIAPNGAT